MKKKLVRILVAALAMFVIAVVFNPRLLMLPIMLPMALTGRYTAARFDAPFLEAHERAVRSFVESEGFGISRMRHKDMWNERTVLLEGVVYAPWQINLIGLTTEKGFRYFEDPRPPLKKQLGTAAHRKLSEVELAAVEEIKLKDSPFVKVAATEQDQKKGAVRVIAPIRASQSCLECHRGKVGDLLGAFDYLLIPEERSR